MEGKEDKRKLKKDMKGNLCMLYSHNFAFLIPTFRLNG